MGRKKGFMMENGHLSREEFLLFLEDKYDGIPYKRRKELIPILLHLLVCDQCGAVADRLEDKATALKRYQSVFDLIDEEIQEGERNKIVYFSDYYPERTGAEKLTALHAWNMPEKLALGTLDMGEEKISEDIIIRFTEKDVVIRIQREENAPRQYEVILLEDGNETIIHPDYNEIEEADRYCISAEEVKKRGANSRQIAIRKYTEGEENGEI